MPARSSIDYCAALYGETSCRVEKTSGKTLTLHRAGLGRHYYLRQLENAIPAAALEDRVSLFREWLRMAGIDDKSLSLTDLVRVFVAAKQLNQSRGRPAWSLLDTEESEPTSPRISDYEGRGLARVVHALALHYGWNADDILELSPEVAMAHLQECILHDHRTRKWQYFLSEVSWEYDRTSRSSKHRELPSVPWDTAIIGTGPVEPVSQAVKDKYYPKGKIIDFTKPETVERFGPAPSHTSGNETS